jgi:hypothetical protein
MPLALSIDLGVVQHELAEAGFSYLPESDQETATDAIAALGKVIQITDVSVNPESTRMVTSAQALDVHTDHYKADLIAWYCVQQCDEGGETILVDAEAAYASLPIMHQRALERVRLTEHKVFADDQESHALVEIQNGRRKFYYSFWLLTEPDTDEEREALNAFRTALDQVPRQRIKLQPGDVLVIDNGRMLHGRTAIEGNKQRLLKRYWVRREHHSNSNHGSTIMETTAFVLPEPITKERIQFLQDKGIDPVVAALDLSMIKMKLQDLEEGKGWDGEECEEAEVEYKRFLTMNRLFPRSIVPTTIMDTMWHYHILDTHAYHRDSHTVFGEYFHHFPYFGMRGEQDEQNLNESFETTKHLYEETFGESILREGRSSCKRDCQSRCWHACSNKDPVN